jgi:hypothetical protein
LVGTILEPLQERPERRRLAGLPRPGKTKVLPGASAGGEQFCTDAVGRQAYLKQRLGAHSPALLPVKPILQVSGPSRGWLSVWGSFHVAKLGVTQVGSSLRMPKIDLARFDAGHIAVYINKLR